MNPPFAILLTRAFRAQQDTLAPLYAQLGLNLGHPKFLWYFLHHEDSMQKDLAEFFELEPATISKQLTELEALELLTRTPVSGNKRAVRISITEKGRTYYRKTLEYQEQVKALALNDFTEEEKAQFTDFLTRMHGNLTKSSSETES